jgi:hypothetical protein
MTEPIPSAPNREIAPDAATDEVALAAPDAADAARLVAEATIPDDDEPDREADPEADMEPVAMDDEADLVMDADDEPLIEPVADPAPATASEAIPFPIEEKVWQLDEAGVEYGVCGVTVWPTVHNSVAPPDAV